MGPSLWSKANRTQHDLVISLTQDADRERRSVNKNRAFTIICALYVCQDMFA